MSAQREATAPLSNGQPSQQPHVLIIGAGITGLVLGQALKKHDIPFTIFERDPDVSARGRGWGLTIHWGLQTFLSLLPQHLVDRLSEVYVDPEASKSGENGNFLFFDLHSGEARWKVPPAKRVRVSRERLRALLLDGLDVKWSKTLTAVEHPNSRAVTAHFSDLTTATGSLLIGADGTQSHTRSHLLNDPKLARNNPLPVRLLGASVIYPRPLAEKLRALDPFFFQGGDPASSAFMYYSFLDTPSNNTRPKGQEDTYECQIILSYPFRRGFKGKEQPIEVPADGPKRVVLMKSLAEGWAEPFKECVMSIPEDSDIKTIKLEDWVPRKGTWNNRGGTVTLVGDAAHAMTMYRGEAANHGIMDVSVLLSKILPVLSSSHGISEQNGTTLASLAKAIDAYEEEMIGRTGPAVLTSRQACLDAHEYSRITDQSALISKRVKITEE